MPNSYIPNVIKTPAVAALNTLKNTASNMFGFTNNKGANNGGGVMGNMFANAGERIANVGSAFTNAGSAAVNKMNNIGTSVLPNVIANATEGSAIPWGIIMALIMLGVLVGLIVYFYEDLKRLINQVRGEKQEPVEEEKPAPAPETVTITPPQNIDPVPPATSIERLLPSKKEVFNISSNRFMYEDAEPLCKALGAELATYDQVKDAFDKGADWCNYGWSKGQMALFPTQKETWDKLQAGPEGQRMACGAVGMNGGHFDNPEMRFGVNCFGVKPSQSAHDAGTKAKGYPLSPDALEFDRKVAKYRSEADHIDVLPFKEGNWND